VLCRIVRCGVAASRSMVVFPPRCMSAAQVPICRFDERLFCSAREDPPDGANMSTAASNLNISETDLVAEWQPILAKLQARNESPAPVDLTAGRSRAQILEKLMDRGNWNSHQVLKNKIGEAVLRFRIDDADTGSAAVQCAVLTEKINNLERHIQANKQDKMNKRILAILLGRRQQMLKYLRRTDFERYWDVTSHYNLEHINQFEGVKGHAHYSQTWTLKKRQQQQENKKKWMASKRAESKRNHEKLKLKREMYVAQQQRVEAARAAKSK